MLALILPSLLIRSSSSIDMAAILTIFVVAVLGRTLTGEAAVFTVGGSAGWDISADLPSWVANKSFHVGDVLLFQYSSYHSLYQVDKAGYENCTTNNALLSSNNGNTSVPLTVPGDEYFICGTELHCLGGMKLQVQVQRGAVSVSPAGAPRSPEIVSAGAPTSPTLVPRPSAAENNRFTPVDLPSGASVVGVELQLIAWLWIMAFGFWNFK